MGHAIYLADDEKSKRELLHSFLTSDGYAVRSFESGDALLEAFQEEPAELVILDIMMPGTDGLAVCRELRTVSDIPIILLTAKDSASPLSKERTAYPIACKKAMQQLSYAFFIISQIDGMPHSVLLASSAKCCA
ncbi:MAG: response regulator [Oscillospiraceae bacterium]